MVDGDVTSQFSYDSRGNRVSAEVDGEFTSYDWNALSQLTKLDETNFAYGANGIRTSVDDAAQVYDQGLKLLSDGAKKYLWDADGSLLAQAALGSSEPAQQAVTDMMGSVYSVVAGHGAALAAVAEYAYSVFGERELVEGTDVSAMGFTSEQHDDSGLVYLRYRYLDPAVGQFISEDPLLAMTMDAYGYASGNPLQLVDPLGLFSWGDAALGLGVVGAGLTIAGLTVATGGAGLLLAAGVVGYLGAGASVAQTTVDCSENPNSSECKWGVAGTALSAIPLAGPVSRLGSEGISAIPRGLSTVERGRANAINLNKRMGAGTVSVSGPAFEMLNRYCN